MADGADGPAEAFGDRLEESLEGVLQAIEGIADPLSRYQQAARAEAFLMHAANWLTDLRASSTLRLHESGASYAAIAEKIGLSRARAQQLVNRGREVDSRSSGLLRRQTELIVAGHDHRAVMREEVEEGRHLGERTETARKLRARNRRFR